MSRPRLSLLPDFAEEHWPSMDLCAEMLFGHLSGRDDLAVEMPRPTFRRPAGQLPLVGRTGAARNADRLWNRMKTYPRFAATLADRFDWFHLIDHSYAQVLRALPPGRAGVFCHDLDTFRCVLDPAAEPRPRWFRAMVRTILDGFSKAVLVFHTTEAVRSQILRHGSVDESKLVHAPLGTAPEFTPGERTEGAAPFLLHVGSCIPRKRIDVLLDVFAEARRSTPELRLIQAGGEFTAAQRQQMERLGIGRAVEQRRQLAREQIAQLYRDAALVLVPSETEGFGLPVVEAMACGAAVVASDIAALREVGGEAAVYCPVADVHARSRAVGRVLSDPAAAPSPHIRSDRAARFSWRRHADVIAQSYLAIGAQPAGRRIERVAV